VVVEVIRRKDRSTVDDSRAAYTLEVEASEAVNDSLNGACAVEQCAR